MRLAEGGASYVEMAAALGLKVGTIKSKLNRARLALQRLRIQRELAAKEQATVAGLKVEVGGNA